MSPSTEERVRRAWFRHPVVAFFRHSALAGFYEQLHSLVAAGVPLTTALQQLQFHAPTEGMERGLSAVLIDVQRGSTLGDALRKHGGLFDDANVELVAFAEEAGRLEPVLQSLIEYLEKVQRQRWEAVAGALWPLYLAGTFIFLGPLFGAIQGIAAGGAVGNLYLSGLARSLLTTGLLVGSLFAVPLAIAALDREAEWDRFLRQLPFVSAPMRRLASARFVMALGLATGSGVEVVRALRLAAKATSSPSVLENLGRAELRLRTGGTLVQAVEQLRLLDRQAMGALSVAETTGTLDTALERLGRDLQAASLRASRALVLVVTGLVAAVLVVKIVAGMLGVILGPIKHAYDAAGGIGAP